jgi:cardiolipin synthase
MHAKLLVIDRMTALVGSANLAGYGLERNLECGVLIRGGPVPGLLADHVMTADELVRLPNH